jgi:hypothetical protein
LKSQKALETARLNIKTTKKQKKKKNWLGRGLKKSMEKQIKNISATRASQPRGTELLNSGNRLCALDLSKIILYFKWSSEALISPHKERSSRSPA